MRDFNVPHDNSVSKLVRRQMDEIDMLLMESFLYLETLWRILDEATGNLEEGAVQSNLKDFARARDGLLVVFEAKHHPAVTRATSENRHGFNDAITLLQRASFCCDWFTMLNLSVKLMLEISYRITYQKLCRLDSYVGDYSTSLSPSLNGRKLHAWKEFFAAKFSCSERRLRLIVDSWVPTPLTRGTENALYKLRGLSIRGDVIEPTVKALMHLLEWLTTMFPIPLSRVDYTLFINPTVDTDNAVPEALHKLSTALDGSINHTAYSRLSGFPVALSIETKRYGGDRRKADAQTAAWHASQWTFLQSLAEDKVSELPFLPGTIVHAHEWKSVVTTRNGKETVSQGLC
ncbi:hypothetical protein FSARC_12282 [Fusarium sarcochroum]|uniref:PD-(D/E)XK nuclease-like domain-containing protein n=1 Tax=Fusarium sarcochroum TaxID=1208366 RepID=A0A8H4T9X2_9HYPO|nr:hypothetical protein FSARC_12282 [Fusarium sarcochroum]